MRHCPAPGHCASGSFNGTIGVVAHLRGGTVLSETFDDANDYVGGLAEASIFPSALRTEALELMSYDGPPAYDHLARTTAGC